MCSSCHTERAPVRIRRPPTPFPSSPYPFCHLPRRTARLTLSAGQRQYCRTISYELFLRAISYELFLTSYFYELFLTSYFLRAISYELFLTWFYLVLGLSSTIFHPTFGKMGAAKRNTNKNCVRQMLRVPVPSTSRFSLAAVYFFSALASLVPVLSAGHRALCRKV